MNFDRELGLRKRGKSGMREFTKKSPWKPRKTKGEAKFWREFLRGWQL